jgi:predicted site-specific integrase-resolvase
MVVVDELLNKKKAAAILGISTVTLDRLRQSGLLTCRKIGSQIRFLPEDLRIYLDKVSCTAGRPAGGVMRN